MSIELATLDYYPKKALRSFLIVHFMHVESQIGSFHNFDNIVVPCQLIYVGSRGFSLLIFLNFS